MWVSVLSNTLSHRLVYSGPAVNVSAMVTLRAANELLTATAASIQVHGAMCGIGDAQLG